MLEFSNIELQANNKRFTKQDRKLIRISYKNSISSSKHSNQYVSETNIKWAAPLTLPVAYEQDIDFEVYDKHEFGFNPEEMQTLLYGTIRISEGQKTGKFVVYSSGEDHKKVGSLVMEIKKGKSAATANKESSTTISSILVRKTKELFGKGYMLIKLQDKKVIRTETVDPISGEYLFLEQYQLGSPGNQSTLIFQLYSSKDDSLKAVGQIPLSSCSNSNKMEILETGSKRFGEIYFQLQTKGTQAGGTKGAGGAGTTNNNSRLSQHHRSEATLNQFRSHSESRLTRFGSSRILGTSRPKRVSVVHNNNDIFFPKEQRFLLYQDKQTNIISYSKLPSMKFLDPASKKYYKGAAIGKGEKTDFTYQYRQNPGVGDYKLPSIFDRY